MYEYDKPREECGVFGIAAISGEDVDTAAEAYSALYALQHRGQHSCGIAVTGDCGEILYKKGDGLVGEVINDSHLSYLHGRVAIGHVRYAAAGGTSGMNAQPLVVEHVHGGMAVAFNGQLLNARQLRRETTLRGGIFHTTTDAETICYEIVRERIGTDNLEDAIIKAMPHLSGAYSLLIMSGGKLYALRDPHGIRPLCIGRLDSGAVCIASESCALDAIGASFVRDIEPGELVITGNGKLSSVKSGIAARPALCCFEYVYFARPDSVIDGLSVEAARQNMGRALARGDDIKADVVVGVPDSALSAALGYSLESGVPYCHGFVKNRYIGRTFIQGTQSRRERSVKIKLNALESVIRGKSVVMVDDSIVRGTTLARAIRQVREAGAREVHMRVASPPFLHPCYYGTDIPNHDVLLANNHSIEEIRDIIGADSLRYLTEGELRASLSGMSCCEACFTGEYPVAQPYEAPGGTVAGRNVDDYAAGER